MPASSGAAWLDCIPVMLPARTSPLPVTGQAQVQSPWLSRWQRVVPDSAERLQDLFEAECHAQGPCRRQRHDDEGRLVEGGVEQFFGGHQAAYQYGTAVDRVEAQDEPLCAGWREFARTFPAAPIPRPRRPP